MSIGTQRARLFVAVITAFAGGLIVASGLNWTKLGFAQTRPMAAVVQPIAEASNAFVAIANNVTPAVVSIEVISNPKTGTTSQREHAQQLPHGVPPGMEDFFRQFDIPQQQRPMRGQGSGFIVTSSGYILTNNHVITNSDRETIADKVTVKMLDHRVFTAKVVGHDRTTDVAVIKIDGSNFPTVSLGNDVTSRIGEWVLAIGNPLGLENTVTAGIISAKGRSLAELMNPNGTNQYAISDLIQTDAAINPGNSGGVLTDDTGRVIGVTAAIESASSANAGIGFVIPSTIVNNVIPDLIKSGSHQHPYLGMSGVSLNVDINKVMNLDPQQQGALVETVNSGDPANKAGLQASNNAVTINGSSMNVGGDVVIAADGTPITSMDDLISFLETNTKVGQTITLTILRNGKQMSVDVTLGTRPAQPVAFFDPTGANQNSTLLSLPVSTNVPVLQ